MRNWLRSSRTRLRLCSIKASNLTVNFCMRSRSSSKPKFVFGSESAIEGAAVDIGALLRLCDIEGSNAAMIARVCGRQSFLEVMC